MELDLFYDTETSGFKKKSIAAHDKDNAWIQQLGFILSTKDHIYLEGNLFIQSEGRSINPHAFKVHKITTDKCDEFGIREHEAVAQFYNALRMTKNIICHNEDFDRSMIELLISRYAISDHGYTDLETDVVPTVDAYMKNNYYKRKNVICTMKSASIINFCNIPGRFGKPKWPKLEELYKILFNLELEDAHDAVIDAMATRRCYYELKRRGVI